MYRDVAHITDSMLCDLKEALKGAAWKENKAKDRHYFTYFVSDRRFFLKIPPGGKVHKHTDTPRPTETYHIPIQTNDRSVCYMFEPDKTAYHLEVGKVYWVNRDIPHESINSGTTDRIHYLIEC